MNEITYIIQYIETENLWENEMVLSRGEFLKQAGQTDLNLYFITEGCLRLYILDQTYEHTIRFGYQQNFVAALDSYISEAPSDLFIQAIRKTKIKVLSKNRFESILNQSAELKEIWLKIVEQLVFQQLEREKDILITSPTVRYKRVLKRSPQLFQEVPHKYIASYLRMTPETLSRLKSS